MDPAPTVPSIYRLPRLGFLLWWVRCDEWLGAAGFPGLEWNEAATLYRAGLDVDEVVQRARDEASLAADARHLRTLA